MRFVCDGKSYDTNTMELVKLDDFATAVYLDHGVGEAFLQTWDDVVGVRICRMTDEEIRKLKHRFGWGQGCGKSKGAAAGAFAGKVGAWRGRWEMDCERAASAWAAVGISAKREKPRLGRGLRSWGTRIRT